MKKKPVAMLLAAVVAFSAIGLAVHAEEAEHEGTTSKNVIPDKVSTFESAAEGQTPDGIKGWDNSGVEKPFTANNYTVVPTVVSDDATHGKVLKMQPKNSTITPRWAIGSELYAEANKTPEALRYKITISADVKKDSADIEKINFKMAADKTDSNFGGQYANVLCGLLGKKTVGVKEWTTLTVTCERTLEELKNNNNGDYYNIYFTSTATLTGPMYIDNVTATVTPILKGAAPTPTPDESGKVPATPTPKPAVTGAIFTVSEGMENGFLVTKNGLFSSADVKDGVLKKSYQIFNIGKTDIDIQILLQVTHKASDGSTIGWYGPAGSQGENINIPAGESDVLTIELPVNDDGTVTVSYKEEAKYQISDLFVRFDFKPEIEEGSKFVVGINEKEADCFKAFGAKGNSSDKTVWTVEFTTDKAYAPGNGSNGNKVDSGDAMPVAIICTAVVLAGTALVIVSKKRRSY